MNTNDPKIREALQTAIDLNNKCCEDVQHAIGRNLDLASGIADRLYISMGAPVIAAMFVMGLMTEPKKLEENLSNETISERTLFAQLFCWVCRDPDFTKGKVDVAKVLPETQRMWEACTGRPFDGSWLHTDMAKHIKGVN